MRLQLLLPKSALRSWRHEILAFFDFLPTFEQWIRRGQEQPHQSADRQGYGYRNRRRLRLHILLKVA
jgi:hypothetical protein